MYLYTLCCVYRAVTGDHLVPPYAAKAEVDRRILQMVEMEDPDLVPDMRVLNTGRKAIFFDPFKCDCKYLKNSLGSSLMIVVMITFSTWPLLFLYMACDSKQRGCDQKVFLFAPQNGFICNFG